MSSLCWEVSGELALCLRTGPHPCAQKGCAGPSRGGWEMGGDGRTTAQSPEGTARSASRAGVWGPWWSETTGQTSCSGQSRPWAAHVG